jgi:hypothetical protein
LAALAKEPPIIIQSRAASDNEVTGNQIRKRQIIQNNHIAAVQVDFDAIPRLAGQRQNIGSRGKAKVRNVDPVNLSFSSHPKKSGQVLGPFRTAILNLKLLQFRRKGKQCAYCDSYFSREPKVRKLTSRPNLK